MKKIPKNMNVFSLNEINKNRFKITNICYEMLSKLPSVKIHSHNNQFDEEIIMFYNNKSLYLPSGSPFIPHEIGHFIEMKDKSRWIKDEFGFNNSFELNSSAVTLLFNSKFNSTKFKFVDAFKVMRMILIRDVKANVIASIIHNGPKRTRDNIFNLSLNDEHCTKLIKYINEFVKRNNVDVNIGKFNNVKVFTEWVDYLIQSTYKKYTLDKIMSDWDERVEYISNFLETKQPE